jgi:hypothetical protein
MTVRYVSPTGTISGAGTEADPWPLAEVLADSLGTFAKPGDDVVLLPGTYRWPIRAARERGFRVRLQGAPDARITVRPRSRFERATIDGGLWSLQHSGGLAGDCPRHVTIEGLEVLVSENLTQSRDVGSGTGSGSYDLLNRPTGSIDLQDGFDVGIINCFVHHGASGINLWSDCTGGALAYGNVVYENGWFAADRRHGHGMYAQNAGPDWKEIRGNMVFENIGEQIHCYGSSNARIDYFRVLDNLVWSTHYSRVLVGGGYPSKSIRLNQNIARNSYISLGYSAGGDDGELIGNVSWFTGIGKAGSWTNVVERDNMFWQIGWRGPSYNGQYLPTPPSTYWLKPNQFDWERASLVVHNYRDAPSITIDFAPWAQAGDKIDLYDPSDFFGTPRESFTLPEQPSISLPLFGPHLARIAIRTPAAPPDPCGDVREQLTLAIADRDAALRDAKLNWDMLQNEIEDRERIERERDQALADLDRRGHEISLLKSAIDVARETLNNVRA